MEKTLHKDSVSNFLKVWHKVKLLEDEGYHVEIITHGSKTYIKAYKDYHLIDVNDLSSLGKDYAIKFKENIYDTTRDEFNIREIRKCLNIKVNDILKVAGVSRQTLRNWELGVSHPTVTTIKNLKVFFLEESIKKGISIEHLLNEEK